MSKNSVRLDLGIRPQFKVMREYSQALEQCRESICDQRDHNELRAEFFLTATRYGRIIYPDTRKFIFGVRNTMNRLAEIEGEEEMSHRWENGGEECKSYQKSGKDLEEAHNFVAAKLRLMKDKFRKAIDNLKKETHTLRKEVETLETKNLFRRQTKEMKETACRRRDEAELLEEAIIGIDRMVRCSENVLGIVHFMNRVLGNCVHGIGEIVDRFKALKTMDSEKTRTWYFEDLKLGIKEFAEGLGEFGDGDAEYMSTVVAIEMAEPANDSAILTWDSELRDLLSKKGF